jgi:predicted flap endonuclease-1-like 5' DNA nuclease
MTKTCDHGHTFEKTSDCPTCPICERARAGASGLPKIGAPATRALHRAGITTLHELSGWTEKELLALHAMGPRAITILKQSLAAQGLSLRGQTHANIP